MLFKTLHMMHTMVPTTENHPVPHVKSAEVDKPCPKPLEFYYRIDKSVSNCQIVKHLFSPLLLTVIDKLKVTEGTVEVGKRGIKSGKHLG